MTEKNKNCNLMKFTPFSGFPKVTVESKDHIRVFYPIHYLIKKLQGIQENYSFSTKKL